MRERQHKDPVNTDTQLKLMKDFIHFDISIVLTWATADVASFESIRMAVPTWNSLNCLQVKEPEDLILLVYMIIRFVLLTTWQEVENRLSGRNAVAVQVLS